MKKIILLIAILFLTVGCTIQKVNYTSIDSLLSDMLTRENGLSNSYFEGYKYYIPRGLRLVSKKDYNARLVHGNTKYYLYVDVIGYYNKVDIEFTPSESYYSKELNYKNKKGYIEITKNDDQYFIEIMYNYAKIETLVEERDLKTAIMNACYILSSIQYNDKVIETLIGDNVLNYQETLFDIFGPHKNSGNVLEYSN